MKITSRVLLVLLSFGISAHAADETIALKAARLFDGKSSSLLQNGVVIVRGDKIVDAGSNLPLPSGAQVIDLGDATLSPGLMDAHTHLTADYSGNYNERRLQELDLNVSEQAIRATVFARATHNRARLGQSFCCQPRICRRGTAQFDQQRDDRRSTNAGRYERNRRHRWSFRSYERVS